MHPPLRATCPHPATAMPLPPKDYAPTTSPSIADNVGKHPRMDREASPTTMSVCNQLSKALQHPEVVSQKKRPPDIIFPKNVLPFREK